LRATDVLKEQTEDERDGQELAGLIAGGKVATREAGQPVNATRSMKASMGFVKTVLASG
jgi:hypothetical protein